MIDAFVDALHKPDFVENLDFKVDFRTVEGHFERMPTLAREVVDLKPDVIFAAVTPAAVTLAALTKTIPIVCPLLADPLRLGLISSMAHPGGNVTGVMFRSEGLVGKQLELALQIFPDARKIYFLVNIAGSVVVDRRELEPAKDKFHIDIETIEVHLPDDLAPAFSKMSHGGAQAVVVQVDALFFQERKQIASLAAQARLPAIYGFRDHVDAGGLISYGANLAGCFRLAAGYVHKILLGAKPGDLPVEFPTKLELIVNMNAARDLGLIMPASLLAFADEVIE